MDHETERLQRAKMFMEYLANGVDPVSNTDGENEKQGNRVLSLCGWR